MNSITKISACAVFLIAIFAVGFFVQSDSYSLSSVVVSVAHAQEADGGDGGYGGDGGFGDSTGNGGCCGDGGNYEGGYGGYDGGFGDGYGYDGGFGDETDYGGCCDDGGYEDTAEEFDNPGGNVEIPPHNPPHNPPVIVHPVCTLFAHPTTIYKGGSATLTWTTTNATRASINQGVGAVALDGSVVVRPAFSTRYVLTAVRGTEVVQCEALIIVKEKPAPVVPKCDFLTASPTTFNHGGGTTVLRWGTTNADSVTIDQGIGSVAVDGSESVTVRESKTFTLTARKGNQTDICTVFVKVKDKDREDDLSCDAFSASPSRVDEGDETTLTWRTTGATRVTINHGVGEVDVDGSEDVRVFDDTTYTLTATRGSKTVTCTTHVNVDEDEEPTKKRPVCEEFKASDRNIKKGQSVRLSWETRNGDSLSIDHGVFSTSDDDDVEDGSVTVRPKKDTTYKLTVRGDGESDTCTVKVNVEDKDSDIIVTSTRDRQPITSISLATVPYTGFDAGPFLTGLFYSLLALFALAVSYVVVVKKGSVFGLSLATFGAGRHEDARIVSEYIYSTPVAPVAPVNLPTEVSFEDEESTEEETVEESDDVLSAIENRAHLSQVLFSNDALAMIKNAGENTAECLALVDMIVEKAKAKFPRENGWIALNRERIATLLQG